MLRGKDTHRHNKWMIHYQQDGQSRYLSTYSANDKIALKRSQSLTDDWDHAEERVVFNPDPNSSFSYATDVSPFPNHLSYTHASQI